MRWGLAFICLCLFQGQAVSAQTVSDRMLCEWLPICVVSGECENEGGNPVFSLERVGDTWLWDPWAEWDGFPVAVADTLPAAEAMASDDSFSLGLILVPVGRTEDGALVLDGYRTVRFPDRSLSTRPMRHHCRSLSEVAS